MIKLSRFLFPEADSIVCFSVKPLISFTKEAPTNDFSFGDTFGDVAESRDKHQAVASLGMFIMTTTKHTQLQFCPALRNAAWSAPYHLSPVLIWSSSSVDNVHS